jgi:hypothetical protein
MDVFEIDAAHESSEQKNRVADICLGHRCLPYYHLRVLDGVIALPGHGVGALALVARDMKNSKRSIGSSRWITSMSRMIDSNVSSGKSRM